MNDDHLEPSRDLQRIQDAFCAAWEAGVRMPMAPCLEAVGPLQRHALFKQLLATEIVRRRALGEVPKAEDYLTRFPLFSRIIEELLRERSDPIDPVP